jgi:hypothetical protein
MQNCRHKYDQLNMENKKKVDNKDPHALCLALMHVLRFVTSPYFSYGYRKSMFVDSLTKYISSPQLCSVLSVK